MELLNTHKLSIHLGEEKTKCRLFVSKLKLKNAGKLNVMYNGIEIKQYSKVTYLGRLQPHFDYECTAWYPILTQKLKKKLQITLNKCIHFCLQLDKKSTISH